MGDSKVQKWSAGKGKIRLAWTKWLGRNWIDLRIMRREDDGYVHTRHGVRVTPDQLREMLPALNEMLEHIDNTEEEEKRKDTSPRPKLLPPQPFPPHPGIKEK